MSGMSGMPKKQHFKLKPLSSMHNSQCIHTGLVYLVTMIYHKISQVQTNVPEY